MWIFGRYCAVQEGLIFNLTAGKKFRRLVSVGIQKNNDAKTALDTIRASPPSLSIVPQHEI